MKILITGASGFIGRRLVQKLKPDYEIIESDLKTGNSIFNFTTRDLEEVDGIIHLAGVSRVKVAKENPFTAVYENVLGTAHLLELIRNSRRPIWLLFSSTIESQDNLYALTKRFGEALCFIYRRDYGVEAKFMRFGDVYGEGDNQDKALPTLIRKALSDEDITLTNPEQVFNFMSCDALTEEIKTKVDKISLQDLKDFIKSEVRKK